MKGSRTRPRGQPLVNRAAQYGYAPGSTFKVVTAIAAIDTGAYTPDSTRQRAQRHRRSRACRSATTTATSYGPITLTLRAHATRSTPCGRRSAEQRRRADAARLHAPLRLLPQPQIDYPPDEMSASGVVRPAGTCSRRPARGRRRARRHRRGQTRGHAAADGDGRRRRRQPRPADGAPPDRARSSTPTAGPCRRSPRACRRRDEALDRGRSRRMMEASSRKAPARAARSPASGRRQDRHRADASIGTATQQRLVHRLRARREPHASRSP